MYSVGWQDIKTFVDSRSLNIQYVELDNTYLLLAFDGPFQLSAQINKTDPKNNDQIDFEESYKVGGNKKLANPIDSEGSILIRTKQAQTGWTYQAHCFEFTTSQLNSVYNTDDLNNNLNFTSIKCYNSQNQEITSQSIADISCVKTVLDWEPIFDYEIVSGKVYFRDDSLNETVRLYVIGVPDISNELGGSKMMIQGLNFDYADAFQPLETDGRASKHMKYDPILHTNKLRFILNHSIGKKLDLMFTLEIYKP